MTPIVTHQIVSLRSDCSRDDRRILRLNVSSDFGNHLNRRIDQLKLIAQVPKGSQAARRLAVQVALRLTKHVRTGKEYEPAIPSSREQIVRRATLREGGCHQNARIGERSQQTIGDDPTGVTRQDRTSL